VNQTIIIPDSTRKVFGWIGAICLLLIIPVKIIRWKDHSLITLTIVGFAPSVLGPAGLLFLILSSSSPRLTRLTILQRTILVGVIAIGLEFIQLIPLPGILARVHYTFDWYDVIASMVSASVAYIVVRILINSKR
jgi:hypothetical protein